MTEPIPGPRALPVLGNLLDMLGDLDVPIRGLERLADTYGPIYQATLAGKRRLVCSSAELMEELTNEKRFMKSPPITLSKDGGPKGLFTARTEDPDWGQAHRILMPAFAPLSIQEMFTDMKDIANQLILSWARKGPENRVLATEDFTRLTLDTIALCTMSYRFNSFYSDELHPFVKAMLVTFEENNARATRPEIATKLMYRKNAEFAEANKTLHKIGQGIIDNRRANPTDKKDVLNSMIYGKDPLTGQVMRDELIAQQMITFLIAGHETTSGLLSFALMNLLKNPHTYLKAQKEVDEVIGRRAIEVGDLKNLKYINAVLRETARLTPTVPLLQKHVNPEMAHNVVTIGHGKYKIEPDDHIMILISKSQRDPKLWGETADDFDPDRMCDENFDKMSAEHPGFWKPFGNGKRACIGRPFAWQEALLVVAMVLQNFDVKLDDPNYTMKIKQSLTIKPDNLYIRVSPRKGLDATTMDHMIHSHGSSNRTIGLDTRLKVDRASADESATTTAKPMTVIYGSNTGTCQAFAQRLASEAASHGFKANVMDMDSATEALPTGTPVVVITSSYEGQPPDNAARFMEWLQGCQEGSLNGVEYTVFGCGHRDWAQTFHRIPKLANELMSKCGAKRVAPAGFTDAAKGNLYSDFEDWLDSSFWPHLAPGNDDRAHEAVVNIEVSTNARASSLRYDVDLATVKENKVLTSNGEPTKCHMEIELPSDVTYECGDYLAILPLNSEKSVKHIMTHFGLPWDAVVTVKATGPSTIPGNTPLSVFDVLRSYVELAQPATKKNLRTLAMYAGDAKDKSLLENLANENTRFELEITRKRTSVFNILTQHPSIKLPFGEFLGLLPPLHVRQYSISSSPLANPTRCTITYGVIDTQALSNPAQRFEGVAGNYLQGLKKDDSIQVSVRPSAKKTFRLPLDMEGTPLLMFAAGTGLAPFRGFIQQRAIQKMANPGREMARAVLFLGCRSQTGDRLYAGELDAWVKDGVVEIKYAFSKEKDASEGCAYVPERMMHDANDIIDLWKDGARAYVCGTRMFSEAVREAGTKIAFMVQEQRGERTEAERMEQVNRLRGAMQERVASDVFD
ncbi:uncharacterized protein Z518_08980 [Rhinocladiella mackenziei CBS 650.93]|uniref:Bifunctional cytochrome P450/NADPH--P450 reductase n=1 Tax=Rhinocladiella mackenziei CBS 650.93 TaxID=1442369 RepID=A0A0D2IXC3_9EURO|nr:uncharacterized protein Z518_08980 [Rhinocladiella mackenziei CBS 650.93]KIX01255.1 hypothetical protein Z518_08980 [Rhinocladiella mackenziei CBS 650.93]